MRIMPFLDRPEICPFQEYQHAYDNRMRNGQLLDADRILTMFSRLKGMEEAFKYPVQVQTTFRRLGVFTLNVIPLDDDLKSKGFVVPGSVTDGVWNADKNPIICVITTESDSDQIPTYDGIFTGYDDGVDPYWYGSISELVGASQAVDTSSRLMS